MVAKKGRSVSENPKDYMLRVRMDEQTLQQLDECCEAENLSRSEVVRKGIQEQHSKLKK
jgi:metal-responsive CopG/Arc/MetJ family transcriptional regulator